VGGGSRLAVVVTVAKGYDLGYIWKTQGEAAGHASGGYYINAAQAGEPPGRWWGPGAQALGFTPGQIVQRTPYDAVYQQIDPRTGAKLGRSRGRYPTFADHLARLRAAEPHATAGSRAACADHPGDLREVVAASAPGEPSVTAANGTLMARRSCCSSPSLEGQWCGNRLPGEMFLLAYRR
jgi:TrwC relaxase